ncbi:hypothetical protein W97_00214 [Coniosporium apollinis CBS 100218]|uniref:GPN-loop GTPase 2 n=1 Tax=Coniosporium apollinis (strain CBS 100218) TaxID=1168221 RepID=R7YGR5_CONA1|nr:uncharacterized protein W97_00214 [Coniosporium apollinis CBS 100218]EON61004.1 hypothetical protein W97_00214 [Coniosporium apollinis CBS 100218]
MPFAQLVIGAPGAGKSTYCDGMQQFMSAIERKCSVVNLDPANDHVSYPVALDVRNLVTLEEIMEAEELGPNGGVLYALEELEHNFEWLEEGLKELGDDYVLFDCPGQVELFTHHSSLRNIFFRLQKLGYRLVVVSLTDSYVLTQPSLYISALLLALRSMLQMDLPHLNVLTKIDNLHTYPALPFNLDFYTEVQELDYLLPYLSAEQTSRFGPTSTSPAAPPQDSKFASLNKAIVELIEEFALVGFETLAVEDKKSMTMLLRAIDRASGYVFGKEGANETVWGISMRNDAVTMDIRDVQERWIDRREDFDEMERREWEEQGRRERGIDAESGGDGGVEDGRDGRGGDGEEGAEGMRETVEEDDDMEAMQREFEAAKAKEKASGGGSGIKIVRKR